MAAKRTKIVCTIGPSVNNPQTVRQLILAGMNVARLNFSHGTHQEHQKVVDMLKEVRTEMKVPLALMLDTKGPEVRLGALNQEIIVSPGDRLELVALEKYDPTRSDTLPLATSEILDDFIDGGNVLLDDGYLMAKSRLGDKGRVFLEFMNAGRVRSRKSLNIPQASLSLPAITDQDRLDLLFAVRNEMDWIAASFIRSADHVLEMRRFLRQNNGGKILIAAKIENQEGVDHFDEIVHVADGIMVARGDLGVEVPLSRVPRLQKMMIRKACLWGKPVITATQMLESMIQNPRPTRAEVSDVANAIYDNTSAVMLSGETAVGKYPVETVQMMSRIIEEAENDLDHQHPVSASESISTDVTSCVAMATVKTAENSVAEAIFCVTDSGRTAKLIASHRPSMGILASATDERVYHQLALCWGVEPVLTEPSQSMEEAFKKISQYSLNKGLVEEGDLVLMTSGNPFGVTGMTNVIMLDCIGDVFLKAQRGFGPRVQGQVTHVLGNVSLETVKDRIVIIRQFTPDMEPILQEVKGVILDNALEDIQSEEELLSSASRLGVAAVIRARGAMNLLQEGEWIKIDPSRAFVFRTKCPQK